MWLLLYIVLIALLSLLLVLLSTNSAAGHCTSRATYNGTRSAAHGSACSSARRTAYHGTFLFTAPVLGASAST